MIFTDLDDAANPRRYRRVHGRCRSLLTIDIGTTTYQDSNIEKSSNATEKRKGTSDCSPARMETATFYDIISTHALTMRFGTALTACLLIPSDGRHDCTISRPFEPCGGGVRVPKEVDRQFDAKDSKGRRDRFACDVVVGSSMFGKREHACNVVSRPSSFGR